MRTAIVTSLLLAGLPAISLGQSDLQKIGRILQGVQQLQQQQNQKNYSAPPQNGPYQYKMVPGNPNSSGNQNQGNFGPNNFFGPSGNGPGQVIYPNNRRPPTNTYPHGTYPSGTYPNGTYPSGTYPSTGQVIHNHQHLGTYPQGSTQHQTLHSGTVSSGGTTVYSGPPTVPVKTYSRLPIVLRCAPEAVGTCNYELLTGSGKACPYAINAGQTQNLVESTDWAIRYRSQPGAAHQTYRLRGGKTYEIHKTGENWHFYMVP